MKKSAKNMLVFSLVVTTCLLVIFLSLSVGASRLSFSQMLSALTHGDKSVGGRIFYYVRLPRTLACIFAGAALAVSGAVIEGVLSNRLASPGIIGVNAGAGLGVTLCCAAGMYSGWMISASAFVGAFVAVLFVSLVSLRSYSSRSTVILCGVAVNSLLTAVNEGVVSLSDSLAQMSADFKVGGFSGVSYTRLIPAAVMIVISLIIVLSLSRELDILTLGEDMAVGLGLCAKRARTVLLMLSAVLAGAAVSFAGLLGFVGLIVPNMVRIVVGCEGRRLISVSAVVGAVFVTLCDVISRVMFAPFEIPTGIIMSVIGAPFFIFLLFYKKGAWRHE